MLCVMPTDELLSTAQVATRLGKSVATVNRYVKRGVLEPAAQGPGERGARLYDPADVDALAKPAVSA